MKPMPSKFSRPTTAKKPDRPEKVQKVKTVTGVVDDNLIQLMEQLIISQKQCQKTGKYVEAQGFKRKVKAVQQQIEKRDFVQIKQRHDDERKEIQQAHLQELNIFNIRWSERFAGLEEQVSRMQNQLIQRHQQQLRMAQDELRDQKGTRFKESPQLLNLKKIQQELAKQQNYLEAHQVQVKAAKIQKEQYEKWKKDQLTKNRSNINVMKQKQENQLSALKQRIDLMFDQRNRQKQHQEQQIILKYQNVLKQLDYQQKQELGRYQKAVKLKNVQKKTKIGILSASKVSLA